MHNIENVLDRFTYIVQSNTMKYTSLFDDTCTAYLTVDPTIIIIALFLSDTRRISVEAFFFRYLRTLVTLYITMNYIHTYHTLHLTIHSKSHTLLFKIIVFGTIDKLVFTIHIVFGKLKPNILGLCFKYCLKRLIRASTHLIFIR